MGICDQIFCEVEIFIDGQFWVFRGGGLEIGFYEGV